MNPIDETAAQLLIAIRDNPDDDTPRLVYADRLDELGDHDRAEFVRTQVEASRLCLPGSEADPRNGIRTAADGSLVYDSPPALARPALARLWSLQKRESALLAAHPEWSSVPCPGCKESRRVQGCNPPNCSTCGGSGDLLRYRVPESAGGITDVYPVEFRRGFLEVVTVPTLGEAVWRWDVTGGRYESATHWLPNDWGRAVVAAVPTLREVRVADRSPFHSQYDSGGQQYPPGHSGGLWFDADITTAFSHLGPAVFGKLKGGILTNPHCREYPTPEGALSALGPAVCDWLRGQQ